MTRTEQERLAVLETEVKHLTGQVDDMSRKLSPPSSRFQDEDATFPRAPLPGLSSSHPRLSRHGKSAFGPFRRHGVP